MSKWKNKCCSKHGKYYRKHHKRCVFRFHSILGIEESEEEPEIVQKTEVAEEAHKAEPKILRLDDAPCAHQSKETEKTQNLRNGTRMFHHCCALHCMPPIKILCITAWLSGAVSGYRTFEYHHSLREALKPEIRNCGRIR